MRRLVGLVLLGLAACGDGGAPPVGDDDVAPSDPDADPGAPDARDEPTVDAMPTPDAEPPFPFVRCASPDDPLPPLVEDRSYYAEDTLDVMEIAVTLDDLEAFAAVNAGVADATVPVVFTQGDYSAPGTLKVRGGKSRENAQKNYKIELAEDADRWQHQREINLNKHMTDITRARNKLAFDIFQTVPDFTSLRTRFAHLTINGEDYGLYTWIEEPDKKFLKFHGLDPDGQLYKPTIFWFQDIPASIAAIPEMMELIIDPKANEDNAKLLRMLGALHAPDLDIDAFFARYFQRDNLVTWLAVNLLLNDIDSTTQNFYLYSPSSCEGWYLLPWDYDGAWGFYAQHHDDTRPRWQAGLNNWWVSDLWEEFFKRPANVAAVEAKMAELSQTVLTDAITAQRLATYHDLILPFISSSPDIDHLPGHYGGPVQHAVDTWTTETNRIMSTTSRFAAEYQAVVERPMPVHVAAEHEADGRTELEWKRSFDVQGDPLTYDVQVATAPTFAPGELLLDVQDTAEDEWLVALPPGTYYWRLIIEDHKTADSWQYAYDPYFTVVVP